MIDTLEAELRSAMDSGSEHLELPEGMAQRAWAAGRRPRAPQRGARRRWHAPRFMRRIVATYSRPQLAFAAAAVVIVAIVGTAFALGGSSAPATKTAESGSAALTATQLRPQSDGVASHGTASSTGGAGRSAPSSPGLPGEAGHAPKSATDAPAHAVPMPAPSAVVTANVGGGGVTATRVVKTGSLSLSVKKGLVGATITKLTTLTTSLGGYVSQSRTDEVDGSPAGSLTLRIPVDRFENAVTAATALGHETSLSTNAHDVTGKFVDLQARLSALKRTRATYLTILSRARTIGQTLSVQQRVNDIQQQIEQRQGELKVLRNQSADGTLTVDVAEAGAAPAAVVHHHRSGWSKAWHNSTGRFNRGIQAIIGGLGPLLLALLLLALVYVIGRIVLRGRTTA